MRLKVMPCLKPFISATRKGNRNENLFKAVTHLRYHNPKAKRRDIFQVSYDLNKCLEVPVTASEIRQIIQHCLKQPYHTTCRTFKKHCHKCTISYKKTPYRQKHGYWKILDKNNRLKIKGSTPLHTELYLWDILDLDTLTDEQKTKVMLQREKKGIDPNIDSIIKEYNIPIGDEALQEYLTYKKTEVE